MSIPSRFCPNCGKPVAMEAKFCPSCGATIPTAQAIPPVQAPTPAQPAYPSYGPSYQTPYQQSYMQQPAKKSNTKIIIAVVIIIVVIVAGLGTYAAYTFFATIPNLTTQHSLTIANSQYSVPPSRYYYFNFTLPPTAFLITVNGTFTSTGTVRVLVMDDSNYITFHNGQTGYYYYYNSGNVTSGTITANLPTTGTYHLVYSNSGPSTITVTTTATAYYR